MRKNLLDDFLNEEPTIYLPSFRYREDKQLISLSIEKYFIVWLNSYWHLLKENRYFSDENYYLNPSIYVKIFLLLVDAYSLPNINNNQSSLVLEILDIKMNALDEILKIGDKSKQTYNRLQLQCEKDKILFEKEINKLRG